MTTTPVYTNVLTVPTGPHRPDGFFDDKPIELKPDTPSGIRAGRRQLKRYVKEFNADRGYLVLYGKDGSYRVGGVSYK